MAHMVATWRTIGGEAGRLCPACRRASLRQAACERCVRGAWHAQHAARHCNKQPIASLWAVPQVSLLPVMAAHQGTYHCYLSAFKQAGHLYEEAVKPLLDHQQNQEAEQLPASRHVELRALVWAVFSAHLGV